MEEARLYPHGYTLSDISHATGISVSYLSNIACGVRTPSIDKAARLASYLGMSISELYDKLAKLKPATPRQVG